MFFRDKILSKLDNLKFAFVFFGFLFLPFWASAEVHPAWSLTPTINGSNVTAQIEVQLTAPNTSANTPSLNLILFIGSDGDFDPYLSSSTINGVSLTEPVNINFALPQNITSLYLLPVLVDQASYTGAFPPYDSSVTSQFQVYSVGGVSVTQVSGAGGNDDDSTDTDVTDNNPTQTGDTDNESTAIAAGFPVNVLQNPLAVSDLNSFIVGLLNALLKIGIPVMTVFLVYSGLRLVIARGNEKELIDAKKNLLWVIIGSAILLGAWTLVRALKGTFDQIDLAYITSLIDYIV